MNIVFGGSFDPVTIAHERIVGRLIGKYRKKIESIILVPTGDSYSNKSGMVLFEHRAQMLRLAFAKRKNILISDVENRQKEFGGTFRTLSDLKKDYKDICFVLGYDQLDNIKSWINWQELVENTDFIVISRPKYTGANLALLKSYSLIELDLDLSSSDFRLSGQGTKGKKMNRVVSSKVLKYIIKNNLYEVNDV